MAGVKKYSPSFHGREGARNPNTYPGSSKLTTTSLLKEGVLYKRQRGQKSHDLRGLRFQQRYCVLSSNMLAYYGSKKDVGNEPSGTLPIAKIKIVERVPEMTFKKPCCFQVGSEKEVIYFGASSDRERDEWIEAFRIATFGLKKNQPLPYYHTGAFGKVEKNQWSCCHKLGKEAKGCAESTIVPPSDAHREGAAPPQPEMDTESPKPWISTSLPISGNVSLLECAYDVHDPLNNEESGECFGGHDHRSDSEEESVINESELLPTGSEMYTSNQSVHSEDSGRGNSIFDLTADSPATGRRNKLPKHSTISSEPITEEVTHVVSSASSQVACPLTFTRKTSIHLEEGHSTSVLCKGVDSLITTTSTGKVFLWSKLNTTKPQKRTIFADGGVGSVSAWGNNFVIGSSKLYFRSLESLQKSNECYENLQDMDMSLKLAAFGPDGSLFFASKNGYTVNMLNLPEQKEWSSLRVSTKSTTIVQVPGQMFSLTVSPHPNQPWLAVGFTHLKDKADYVSIFNYKTRDYIKPDIEIGQNSCLCLTAFTYDGQYLYVGSDLRIQCFNPKKEMQTLTPTEFNYTFKEDDSVTSMCCSPVCHHFAVGLKSGIVKVFMGDPSQFTPAAYTITETKSNIAVTSLSYTRDGMKTAIAFQDGSIEIWKASKPPEERLLTRTGTLEVTSEGQTYHSQEDGYTITIPEGAVDSNAKIRLHYGVAPDSPYGPYEFEDGAYPVSPIISLCPEPADTVFLKPIEVTLPHFIACRTPEDCKKLCFYKTQNNNFRVEIGTKIYQFEKVEDCSIVHFSRYCTIGTNQKVPQGAATLYTTHCCDLCIGKYSEDDTSKAMLSLRQIVPKHPDLSQTYEIYYCLSYFLPTCSKTVEAKYPSHQYIKEERVVSFLDDAKSLQMHTSAESLQGGWQLCPFKENCEIVKKDMCFWEYEVWKIKELVQERLYPPKIPLRIQSGKMVKEGVVTTISFSGVKGLFEGTKTKFALELVKPSLASSSSIKSNRSSSTPSYQSAASVIEIPSETYDIDQLKREFYEIASKVECKHLALALLSASSHTDCSYLDQSAIDLTNAFLKKGRFSSEDNFSSNFEILSDAFEIATRFPDYVSAIQAALDRLGYNYNSSSQLPHKESANVTKDETSPAPFIEMSSENGKDYYPSNGHEPQSFSSPCIEDPSVFHQMDVTQAV